MKEKVLLGLLLFLLSQLLLVNLMTREVLAQGDSVSVTDLYDNFKTELGFGFGFAGSVTIGDIISAIVPYIFILAGIGVLVFLIMGGFGLMMSRGDEKAVAAARGKITNAIIGFVVIFMAYWIMQILGVVLGLQGFGGLF